MGEFLQIGGFSSLATHGAWLHWKCRPLHVGVAKHAWGCTNSIWETSAVDLIWLSVGAILAVIVVLISHMFKIKGKFKFLFNYNILKI